MYTTCFTYYNNKGVRHKKSRSFCETPAFVLFFEHESIIFRGARLKL